MRRSTAPRRPKRVLRGEVAIQVKAWREGYGLLSREVGGVGPRPRIEGIPISTYAVPIPLDGL